MKIVVLDGYTLNPGDLNWDGFKELGETVIYDRTPNELILERAAGADAVITNKTPLTAETIGKLDKLKYIGVLATGYNVVDTAAARQHNIPVTNIPCYGTMSVAQMVFAHLLNLTQRTAEHSAGVKAGKWTNSKDFCYWDYPLIELESLTLGIVGFGRIGMQTAAIGKAFGMKILAYNAGYPIADSENVTVVELDKLFEQSDVVSLHCPLTAENAAMVDEKMLSKMKPTAFLINTSRGGLVNEQALANALNTGKIAGAGLDVLCTEPATRDNPLLTAKNCYITPHIAWATHSARKRLMATAVDNLKAFINGKTINAVN